MLSFILTILAIVTGLFGVTYGVMSGEARETDPDRADNKALAAMITELVCVVLAFLAGRWSL